MVEGSADELAAADEGDFVVLERNVVAGEEPKNGGGGSGVIIAVSAEAVDIFCGGDEIAKSVGLGFVGEGELEDDAVNMGVGICTDDFFSERVVVSVNVSYFDTNILTILFFKIDVLHDDGIVAVAENEEFGSNASRPEASDLAGLAFFDEAGEFGAV